MLVYEYTYLVLIGSHGNAERFFSTFCFLPSLPKKSVLTFVFNRHYLKVYRVALNCCTKVLFPKTFVIDVLIKCTRTLNNMYSQHIGELITGELILAQRVNWLTQLLPIVHWYKWEKDSRFINLIFSIVSESIRTISGQYIDCEGYLGYLAILCNTYLFP